MGVCAKVIKDGYFEPAEERLDQVGPGCFILKEGAGGSCCWAEVLSVTNFGYECIAHPALTEDAGYENITEGDQIMVKREQIKALGCDRYCFC